MMKELKKSSLPQTERDQKNKKYQRNVAKRAEITKKKMER